MLGYSSVGLLAGLALAVPSYAATPASGALQNILQNTHQSPAYGYPTDLTRGIIPVCVAPLELKGWDLQEADCFVWIDARSFAQVWDLNAVNLSFLLTTTDSDYWRDVPFYSGRLGMWDPPCVPIS